MYPTTTLHQFYLSQRSYQFLKSQKIPHQVLQKIANPKKEVAVIFPFQSSLFDPPHPDALEEALAYAFSRRQSDKKQNLLYLGRSSKTPEGAITLDRPGGKRGYHWKITTDSVSIPDIRMKFPKIIAKIRDKNTKVVLSFGSGGLRLFAHPALIKFLELLFPEKKLRKIIAEVWGCSGGALAGLFYAVGVPTLLMEELGYQLYNERYKFSFSPSKLDVLKNIFLDTFYPTNDQLLKGFVNCQEALRELLLKFVFNKKEKMQIPFYCVAYNLKEKRNEVLTPETVETGFYPFPIHQTDAVDAVIASSSIPIIYVPKKILRGKMEYTYVDGATTEEVPLLSPYRKWKQDRLVKKEKRKKLLVIAVNLFPQLSTVGFLKHWLFRKIPAMQFLQLSATFADLVRQARIDEHKAELSRDPDVTLWELNLPIPGLAVLSTKLIPQIIETAKTSFLQQLLEIEQRL